jgi:hypothetical protein
MKSRDFCYWLQGYFEINGENVVTPAMALSPDQVAVIKRHLAMVFVHEIDPSFPEGQQKALDAAHKIPGPDFNKHYDPNPVFRC